ncbi:MAG: hypothetical protein V1255_05115, partial [Alphaproteobacteria bacterium]|nr:hypothetical protein [Alphaproteobacteria bacterium]
RNYGIKKFFAKKNQVAPFLPSLVSEGFNEALNEPPAGTGEKNVKASDDDRRRRLVGCLRL